MYPLTPHNQTNQPCWRIIAFLSGKVVILADGQDKNQEGYKRVGMLATGCLGLVQVGRGIYSNQDLLNL
ncbi:MAG: hypothetical protein ABI417_18315 [Coleofasciculaceae cyanobacterium]